MKADFWDEHYQNNHFPWDLGEAAPAFVKFFENKNKAKTILIPGAGRGNDALFLAKLGFQVTVLEISEEAIKILLARANEENLVIKTLLGDVTNFISKEKFDFWVEHTCFCAIKPEKRKNYVKTITKNLKPTGFFVGLLFDFPLTKIWKLIIFLFQKTINYWRDKNQKHEKGVENVVNKQSYEQA